VEIHQKTRKNNALQHSNNGEPVFWKGIRIMFRITIAGVIWIFMTVLAITSICAESLIPFSCPSKLFLLYFLSILNPPVCSRVIKASRELSTDKPSKLFEKYCSLSILSNEEQQFCYNSQGFQSEINRLLDLGADDKRICKKIYNINPDFCTSKSFARHAEDHDQRSQTNTPSGTNAIETNGTSETTTKTTYPRKRGVIYE
jgi:hypothetical protein